MSEELWLALTGSVEPSPCFGGLASQSFELLHRPSDKMFVDARCDGIQLGAVEGPVVVDGIWSDGATMWVLDADDRKLYAYNMPTNALLRSLEFDGVEIGFESGRFQYAATAPTATTTITAAASHNGATVTISPADADADTAGHQVNLAQGTNTVTVTVTNGTDTNTYTVAINRSDAATPSGDPMLSSLSIGATNIDLADRITHYTVDVAQDTSTVTVIAAASHTGADVTISPADADTDTADHQVNLARGTNTITVTVVSESGRERHTYTIEVNRA